MKEYHEQLHANKLDILHEMDKFLETLKPDSRRNRKIYVDS